jgi:hypothetical protein
VETSAEPTCDGCGAVRRNFQTVAGRHGADGKEAADEGKCDGGAMGRSGGKRYTVPRVEKSQGQVDPQFRSTAPPGSPIPSSIKFPLWAMPDGGLWPDVNYFINTIVSRLTKYQNVKGSFSKVCR